MDSAPSKRRKTSPTSSVGVSDDNTHLFHNAQNDEYRPGRRASYMSPTKASLARFNPGLLPPTGPTPPRRRGSSGSQVALRNGLSAGPANHGLGAGRAKLAEPTSLGIKEILGPGLEKEVSRHELGTVEAETTPFKRTNPNIVNDIRAFPPEEMREGNEEVVATLNTEHVNLDSNEDRVQLHQSDKASPVLPIDQSHTPSTPSRQGHRGLLSGAGLDEDGEPSLPSTPIQLGLEKPPEPPKGLLSMSPSRRPKKKGPARPKSSPLKPQPEESPQRSRITKPSTSSLGPRIYIENTPKPVPMAQEVQVISMRERLAKVEGQLLEIEGDLIQRQLVSGWEESNKATNGIAKRKEEASMESSRVLRTRQEFHHAESASQPTTDLTGGQIQNVALVDRPSSQHTNNNDSSAPQKVPPLSQRLTRFLPFSSSPPPPALNETSTRHQGTRKTLSFEVLETPITPFTVTTSDLVLLPFNTENKLLQSQMIVLSSPCQSLLLELRLVIDVTSQTSTRMEVIELSDWAEDELGGWLRASSANRSVAAIGTAFGRYWIVCLERLRSWDDAVRKYGDLIAVHADIEGMSWPPTNDYLPLVIPHLCWRSLCMARDAVALVIKWSITIDDNGNVESDVLALPSFPDRWRETEVGMELEKVGDAFKLLLDDKGPTEAISVVAGLLFPSKASAEG